MKNNLAKRLCRIRDPEQRIIPDPGGKKKPPDPQHCRRQLQRLVIKNGYLRFGDFKNILVEILSLMKEKYTEF
jgi:hypothetical protein